MARSRRQGSFRGVREEILEKPGVFWGFGVRCGDGQVSLVGLLDGTTFHCAGKSWGQEQELLEDIRV